MNCLLSDLLDVVSIEANQLAVAPADNDVDTVIAESLEVFAPLAAARGVTVLAEERHALPAHFDRDRVLQVLGNLLGNALKFTAEGGTIEVRAVARAGEIQCSIKDNGPGIAADMLDAIFKPFQQVRSDRRGLGLGLHISRCLIEAQRGRIWVESTVGEGATFHFTLPASSAVR